MRKRGQEGIGLGTLLLIILGVVVLVVLIVGFTKGFDFIFGKIGIAPGQSLQTAVASCEIAGQQELKADYCDEFKEVEIDDVKQLVTCDYLANPPLNKISEEKKLKESCYGSGKSATTEGLRYCQALFKQGKVKSDTRANNVLCASKTCEALGGFAVVKTDTCPPDNDETLTKQITSGFSDSKDSICCVAP